MSLRGTCREDSHCLSYQNGEFDWCGVMLFLPNPADTVSNPRRPGHAPAPIFVKESAGTWHPVRCMVIFLQKTLH